MPTVSVIVPNYNHAPYLHTRIRSILDQTYQDIELILLDDCSSDNSSEVIGQYSDHPLVSHVVLNSRNSGSTFLQWDKGLALSQGRFIWIAESDDYCEPTFLEELVPVLQQHDNVALAFCQSLLVSTDNQITGQTHAAHLSAVITGEHFLRTQMLGTNSIVNASMAVFRKKNIEAIANDYKQMKYCGDWLFWVHLCFTGDVFVSGKYLNYYLRHTGNVASNATRKGYDFLEGNRIYHLIADRLRIEPSEKMHALKERAVEYMRTRRNFHDDAIHKEVWASLMQLDPAMKGLIRKKIVRANILHYATRLNKWIS